jgi:hypothetical protein
VRFNPRPLLIIQPKQAATHLSSPNQEYADKRITWR